VRNFSFAPQDSPSSFPARCEIDKAWKVSDGNRESNISKLFSVANRLYFGDDLAWLRHRDEFPTESVDFVYLDPPFDHNPLSSETAGE